MLVCKPLRALEAFWWEVLDIEFAAKMEMGVTGPKKAADEPSLPPLVTFVKIFMSL